MTAYFHAIIYLSFLFISSQSSAEDHVHDKAGVKIALFDTPPYVLRSEGKLDGFFVEIVKALQSVVYPKLQMAILPRKRLANEIKRQNQDCTFLANSDFTRSNYALLVDTGLSLQMGVLPRRGEVIEKYEDLRALKIAVTRGTTLEKMFDSDLSIDKHFTDNYDTSIKMLRSNRVSAVAGALTSLRYNSKIAQGRFRNIFGTPYILSSLNIWLVCSHEFALSAKSKELADGIMQLRSAGTLKAIAEKY